MNLEELNLWVRGLTQSSGMVEERAGHVDCNHCGFKGAKHGAVSSVIMVAYCLDGHSEYSRCPKPTCSDISSDLMSPSIHSDIFCVNSEFYFTPAEKYECKMGNF